MPIEKNHDPRNPQLSPVWTRFFGGGFFHLIVFYLGFDNSESIIYAQSQNFASLFCFEIFVLVKLFLIFWQSFLNIKDEKVESKRNISYLKSSIL